MLVSVVIRTLNEAKHLTELLRALDSQRKLGFEMEVVIVDSGSEDETLNIAEQFGCRVTKIKKQEFTFGRSLNLGCAFADGEILTFVSGHCVPIGQGWLESLIGPIVKGQAGYSYGRQVGRETTKFSEERIFEKYFPSESYISTENIFCNNANSAISKRVWSQYKFDESVTGLEDMELAKRYLNDGGSLAYIAKASVFHIHDETWSQTKVRYEREAIALQKILPEVHIGLLDFVRFLVVGIYLDAKVASRQGVFMRELAGIIRFRTAQYLGSYAGGRFSRELSQEKKDSYYYPAIRRR